MSTAFWKIEVNPACFSPFSRNCHMRDEDRTHQWFEVIE